VYEISRERLNRFASNSHERRAWSLARMSLKVKVKDKGHQGQNGIFSALSAACVRFMFGETSLVCSFEILLINCLFLCSDVLCRILIKVYLLYLLTYEGCRHGMDVGLLFHHTIIHIGDHITHYTRALQPVATCRQSPYLHKPAVITVMSFSL